MKQRPPRKPDYTACAVACADRELQGATVFVRIEIDGIDAQRCEQLAGVLTLVNRTALDQLELGARIVVVPSRHDSEPQPAEAVADLLQRS